MTATIVEIAVVETSSPEENDLGHIVCHCTNATIAWCGEDVSDQPFIQGDVIDDENPCALCIFVDESLDDRCPWGCECTDKERYLFCGYSEGDGL